MWFTFYGCVIDLRFGLIGVSLSAK